MTRRPVIGLSTGVLPFAYGAVPDYPLNYVPDDYVQAVLAAGGLPLTLPMYDPELYPDGVAEQLELCDGLLLSGGNADVSPATYGEQNRPELGVTTPGRDAHELALLAEARHRGIPVLGICRGIQVVNVAYGGTLFQDLPSQFPETLGHVQTRHRSEPHHDVTVTAGKPPVRGGRGLDRRHQLPPPGGEGPRSWAHRRRRRTGRTRRGRRGDRPALARGRAVASGDEPRCRCAVAGALRCVRGAVPLIVIM